MPNDKPLELSTLSKKDFPLIKDLDEQQEDMVVKLYKKQRVIVDAAAGSGKTSVTTQAMVALQKKGYIKTIYYVVFPVQERSLGYLPGGLAEKIQEYAVPFIQSLIEAGVNPQELDINEMTNVFTMGDFKVVPHTFLRGRTIDNAGVILDEIQNGTRAELKKCLTRITDRSYIAMIGHNGQKDIKDSGFSELIHHFKSGVTSGEFAGIEFAELYKDYRGDFSRFADKLGEYISKEEEV